MLVIGLMSGTSIDGVDAALVKISGPPKDLKIKVVDFLIDPFPRPLRERILAVSSRPTTSDEICRLHFELGEVYARAVRKVCRRSRVPLSKIGLVGSHGQTIGHLGPQGTFQIGEPSVIAERTGITTVANFRPRDVAAGGHGAPLAPIFHYLFFRHRTKNIAVHNLGGISNLTSIPAGASADRVVGFDTGPANMVIDGLLRHFTDGHSFYDHGGRMAARGIVSLKLLKELMRHPFILKKPPKTSGREEFGEILIRRLLAFGRRRRLRPEDLVATATAWTALSLAENYRRFIFPRGVPDEIIFGGGGIHNQTLMTMIRRELAGIKISTFDDHGLPADAAEAVCFAVLATLTYHGKPTNLPSVTGADHRVILGNMTPGSRGI